MEGPNKTCSGKSPGSKVGAGIFLVLALIPLQILGSASFLADRLGYVLLSGSVVREVVPKACILFS